MGNPLYLGRQQKRSQQVVSTSSASSRSSSRRPQADTTLTFDEEFGHVQMTRAMEERDQAINQAVQNEWS
jgi:hypothetical protein